MSEPIDFWKSVEKTNTQYTKTASISGQTRTSVDAQYKKRMITEKFGMYGLGWGVIADSEKYERVHYENQTCILNYTAKAFYVWDGNRGELPIAAQIKESFVTKNGSGYLKIDDEAVKKVRTDALTKAFTDLGFCSDIHMGKFDDQDYVRGLQAEQQIKEADEREAEQKKQYETIKAWIAGEVDAAKQVKNDASFVRAIDRIRDKAITRCNAAGFSSKGFEDRLEQVKQERSK